MTALSPTGVILGAGFSYVAGLPLARDLFDREFYLPSQAAKRRFAAVLQSWRAWQSMHQEHGPEQFLTKIYRSPKIGPIPWSWATEMVGAILATPLPHDRGPFQTRYAGSITRPVNVTEHNTFWEVMLSHFAVSAVVTTNYDLLAERGLRHRPTQRPKRPGFHYGGLVCPQVLHGTAFREREIELEGTIPLYKLHGSLNWGLQKGVLCLYRDSRPAFRHGGDAQIIPPVEEKDAPPWLGNVWNEARQALASCSTWIVCGYSLPVYDYSIARLFTSAAQDGILFEIIVLDPNSQILLDRWNAIAPGKERSSLAGATSWSQASGVTG